MDQSIYYKIYKDPIVQFTRICNKVLSDCWEHWIVSESDETCTETWLSEGEKSADVHSRSV